MAILMHPVTGVPLNDIAIRRKALDFDEALTVHIMRRQGVPYTDIVHHLGTNANRVGEVLRGEAWPRAGTGAIDMIGGDLFASRK
jgi:hypothetical protein